MSSIGKSLNGPVTAAQDRSEAPGAYEGVAVEVRVRRLGAGYSPRRGGIDPNHVELLKETGGNWPPLLVQRSSMRVIDGAHRLAAAKALGRQTVQVVLFDGDDDEARVEAIRANREHGLPLSAPDRKAAAADLLSRQPQWSDGRIAAICSLSPKTVAALRRDRPQPAPEAAAEAVDPAVRVGRDGKRRPVSSSDVRARIEAALVATPDASLRVIAARVHASPETVRRVRRTIFDGEGVAPAGPPTSSPLPTIDPEVVGSPRGHARWSRDSACSSTPEGARFAAWFDGLDVDESALWEHSASIPTSRLYEVIDETHRRARFWAAFADRLERRLRREPSS